MKLKDFEITYFRPNVDVRFLNDISFITMENCNTRWKEGLKEYRLLCREGFICNGSIVPKWLWSLFNYSPTGSFLMATLWHVFIYSTKGKVYNFIKGEYDFVPRKSADKLFYCQLIRSGVNENTAKKLYYAVRIFGWALWFFRKK
jgi:hypothetical protein